MNTWHFYKKEKVQSKVDIIYILIICIYECIVLEASMVKW